MSQENKHIEDHERPMHRICFKLTPATQVGLFIPYEEDTPEESSKEDDLYTPDGEFKLNTEGFDVVTTRDKDAALALNYRRLKNVRRCNNFHTLQTEDVAQHSFYVTMLSLIIGHEISSNGGGYINIQDIATKGIFHDIDEIFFSDIPRNIKHHTPELKESIEEATISKLDDIFEGSGCAGTFVRDNRDHAKDGLTGEIIDAVDMLELGINCCEEVAMGNSTMEPLRQKAFRILNEKEITPALLKYSPTFTGLYKFLALDAEEMKEYLSNAQNID